MGLHYKIARPSLPACVDRPRLLRLALPSPIVVLTAPAGSGKSCFAAQLAAATGGPTAWFLADELDRGRAEIAGQLRSALGVAWADIDRPAAPPSDGDVALSLLVAALETLAGPGSLVMDDVHLLPCDAVDAVLRAVVAVLPPGCRLVVCTRAGVPEALVRARAAGRAVALGGSDLAFDHDECDRMSDGAGVAILERTGGWPLAVSLLTGTDAGATASSRHLTELADVALGDLSTAARELLTVLARVPRFPHRLLLRLGEPHAGLGEFGRWHPELMSRDGEWWAPREWLRDALRQAPATPPLVEAVAAALVGLDEDELAVQLLVADARYEQAVAPLERLAADGLRQGRPAWVRSLIAALPSSARTLRLDMSEAAAVQALNADDGRSRAVASEQALLDLVSRAANDHTASTLQATALLANHHRMNGDARLLAVCEGALGDALDTVSPEDELAGRWSPEDVPAAAEMLRYVGHTLLFAPDAASVVRGRRLVAAALGLLDGVGRQTISLRAWSIYFEALLFMRTPADAIPHVRLAAHRMAELEHTDGAVRLAELATLEFFAGDHHATRASIERARDCAERTGNRIALLPLAAIEVALDVAATSFTQEHDDRFSNVVAELGAERKLSQFAALVAAEFGVLLMKHGDLEAARRYLGVARAALDGSFFAHVTTFRCRRLEGLLRVGEGERDEGRAALSALARDAETEGRSALVTLIETDLAATSSDAAGQRHDDQPAKLRVRVLAPELSVTADGEQIPAPRGYPAKLLAVLVASGGSLTVDAAIEELWPGADPDAGRNRLHGVLLRLRRGLGLPAGGPISCIDDMVRLDATPWFEIDSWEFARHAALAMKRRGDAEAAVELYTGDVLSVQFAYDDTIELYRRHLRRMYLCLAAREARGAAWLRAEPEHDI